VTAPETAAPLGRRALVLVLLGLVVQLLATFHWTPASFIVSAVVGVGLVLLGGALFGWAVWRARRSDDGGAASS
jgi:F0F1-type ATP synthase assembly protein I